MNAQILGKALFS